MTKADRILTGFVALVFFAVAMFAGGQTQIATVTSDSPFQLRGAGITPGQGVPSWPVLPGDLITAGQTPVSLVFADGSTIILAPGAVAKVSLSHKKPVFELESGAAHYTLITKSSVELVTLKTTVVPTDLVGDLQIGSQHLPTSWWTTGHTTLVLSAAGAAAGLGVGVAASNSNGPSVSPSACKNGNNNGNGGAPCP